jgi:protein TonB
MYADRYTGSRGSKPASLGASLLISGGMVLALVYAAPKVIPTTHEPIHVKLIPLDQPPPPKPEPQPHPRTLAEPQPVVPKPVVITPEQPPIAITTVLPPAGPVDLGTATGTAQPQPTPTPLPPLLGATTDPRYADDFQPAYPPEERRAGHEGRVVVRVLIGVDGRVKQIEKVSAASDAFFAATRAQALAKWRFKPATRGDVPVESWKTMGVTFRLQDE